MDRFPVSDFSDGSSRGDRCKSQEDVECREDVRELFMYKTRRDQAERAARQNLVKKKRSSSAKMAGPASFNIWPTTAPALTSKTIGSSARSQESTSASSTLQSHYDASNIPLAISQQTSASAVRDMALRKGSPKIRSVRSFPKLAQPAINLDDAPEVPRLPKDVNQRAQKLDISRLFMKTKAPRTKAPTPATKATLESSPHPVSDYISEIDAHDTLSRRPYTSGHGAQLGTGDRDYVGTNTKINIRRPPKGVINWFDALDDDSDDDFPEVVESWPAQAIISVAQNSQPPPRAAPPRRLPVTPPPEFPTDFHYNRRRRNRASSASQTPTATRKSRYDEDVALPKAQQSIRQVPIDINFDSRLSLSSFDDDVMASSSEPWTEHPLGITGLTCSMSLDTPSKEAASITGGPRQSLAGTQTPTRLDPYANLTEDARRSQAAILAAHPLPELLPATVYIAEATKRAEMALTGVDVDSANESDTLKETVTPGEPIIADAAHMMIVTEEEMALLEMMRKKKAELHTNPSPKVLQEEKPALVPKKSMRRKPYGTHHSASDSSGSGSDSCTQASVTLDTADGLVFPAPPTSFSSRTHSRTPSSSTGRHHNHHQHQDVYRANLTELEADFELPPTQKPVTLKPKPRRTSPTSHRQEWSTDTSSPPPYNHADPYQLAPNLHFSSFDLLPLPPLRSPPQVPSQALYHQQHHHQQQNLLRREDDSYTPSLSRSFSSSTHSPDSVITPGTDMPLSTRHPNARPRSSDTAIATTSTSTPEMGAGAFYRSPDLRTKVMLDTPIRGLEIRGSDGRKVVTRTNLAPLDYFDDAGFDKAFEGIVARKGHSRMSSVGMDVLSAWTALGGATDGIRAV